MVSERKKKKNCILALLIIGESELVWSSVDQT